MCSGISVGTPGLSTTVSVSSRTCPGSSPVMQEALLPFGEDKTFVVGNIGNPYTSECLKTAADTVTVGEISSFQLESVRSFHPAVSAILNITPLSLSPAKTQVLSPL